MPSWPTLVAEPHVALFARTVVGLTLLIAGVAKLGDRRQVVEVVRNYQLLPGKTAEVIGSALPVLEVIIAIGLLVGVLMPWPALAAVALFFVFGGAVTINLLRDRREIACGCFGVTEEPHLSWLIVARNATLAGIAVLAMAHLDTAPRLIERLTLGDSFATVLVALVVLTMGWLWHAIFALWRLPDSSVHVADDHPATVTTTIHQSR